eukprot:7198439-Prymnesium_polylepis.1
MGREIEGRDSHGRKKPSASCKKSGKGNDRPRARYMFDHGKTQPVFYNCEWHYMTFDCNGRP